MGGIFAQGVYASNVHVQTSPLCVSSEFFFVSYFHLILSICVVLSDKKTEECVQGVL